MSPSEQRHEVVAIGDEPVLAGFALAGVQVWPATGAAQVRAAWAAASARAAVVILSPDAAAHLGAARTAPQAPLTVVVPP